MPRRFAFWLLIALPFALVVSGCGSPPPPPAPVVRDSVTDGFYRGTSTRFQANHRACPRPGLVMVQVWDRRFQYRWAAGVMIDAVIQSDGTIQGSGPGISLLGTYTPNQIKGDVTNGDCGLHFTVTLRDK